MEQLDESAAMTSASKAVANSGSMSNIFTTDAPIPSVQSIAYQAQKAAVEAIAAKGPCVIVGRRADQILKGKYRVFSIFISAPLEKRVERVMQREHRSDFDVIQKKVKQIDKERKAYYSGLGSQAWGAAESYDLCINADEFDFEGIAEIITAALRNKTK